MAAFVAIAALFLIMDGFQFRFPLRAVQVASRVEQPQQMRVGTCFVTSKYSIDAFRPDLCMQVDPAKDNYLLLGDSHSAMLWSGLHREMGGAHILQASVAGCNPVYGASARNDCGRMMQYIFNEFLPSHRIQGVILTARWASEEEFEQLKPTVDWFKLHRIPVYLVGPVVEYDTPLPRLLAYSIANNQPESVDQHMKKSFFEMDARMKHKVEDDWKVHYISIISAVCVDGECPHYADVNQTEAFLGDDNHLSNAGSMYVVGKLLASGQLPNEDRPFSNGR
jgi:hypothetical protein